MARIYTRTGDEGETGLFGGGRVPKSDLRVDAYGEVDELNAVLGLALARVEAQPLRDRLRAVQADLFTLGAHLATPANAPAAQHLPPLPGQRIAEFEAWIDTIDDEVGPLRSFVLPGGSELGAALHLARTVCRRAERAVVRLRDVPDALDPVVIMYLNRLSDLLFELARLANHEAGITDTPWRPRE